MHNNSHVVKMILEYAQLLSTAHRFLDGIPRMGNNIVTGRKQTRYVLSDDRESLLYVATHINHPSAVWARKSIANYFWLSNLLVELCKEYTYRYGKVHKCERDGLVQMLHERTPDNMGVIAFTEPTLAMPDEYKVPNDAVQSYRNYYNGSKQRIAIWKNRPVPNWFNLELSHI